PQSRIAHRGTAEASGRGVAEHGRRVAADVDRRVDRHHDLVPTQDAVTAGGDVHVGDGDVLLGGAAVLLDLLLPAPRGLGLLDLVLLGLDPGDLALLDLALLGLELRDLVLLGLELRDLALLGLGLLDLDLLVVGLLGLLVAALLGLDGPAGLRHRGAAPAARERLSQQADGVAADVDRRVDRRHDLVPAQDDVATGGDVPRRTALAAVLDLRPADTPRGRLADDPHGGTAHVHRRVDRHHDLVPTQDAVTTGGDVGPGGAPHVGAAVVVPAVGDLRAADAAGESAADHGHGVAAHVHRRVDRRDHLVTAEDAVATGGGVPPGTALAAVLDARPADAPRGRLADDPDGGAAHVHRRVDRHLELVAAQDAVITVGAVAAGAAAAALVPYGRAAPAARVGAADQGDGVAAGVHGEIDRSVDLVPAQDAVAAGGA